MNTFDMKFPEFQEFKKIPRLSREIIITEKIDGTNGVIYIDDVGNLFAGSRNRWLWGTVQNEIHNDNYGFAKWAKEHCDELKQLCAGYHYGEWMGQGIQRNYGLKEKRFYLFNTSRWIWNAHVCPIENIRKAKENDKLEFCPDCCRVVPVLYNGIFSTMLIQEKLDDLAREGSEAVQGFMNPEGIVIYHTAAKQYFKKTIVGDEKGKTE